MPRFPLPLPLCLLFFVLPAPVVHANSCIGVVTAGSSLNFWRVVQKGALEAGAEYGYTILVRGPMEETNQNAQIDIIKSMLARGCVGIVIAPASVAVANYLNHSDMPVPVVYIDRDYGGKRMSVVKTENFRAGVLAGERMVALLHGKGRVALLRNDVDVITTNAREEGFRKGATEGGLEVVLEAYIGVTVGDARSKAFKVINGVEGLDGVFTSNEPTTIGTLIALEKVKRSDIIHVGFDVSKQILAGVESGRIHAVISQRPREMGYRGVVALAAMLSHSAYQEFVDTGVFFVTKQNLNDPDLQAGLAP